MVSIMALDGQAPHLGNCQPASGLLWMICTSGPICLGSKDVSTCHWSEGNLTSTASKGPGESRRSKCLLGVGSWETLLGAHPLYCPTLFIRGQPLSYCSKRKPLGHFCYLPQVTVTWNRQHLTVQEPLAALGEIMITREKSYYCHHAFIMQMILR